MIPFFKGLRIAQVICIQGSVSLSSYFRKSFGPRFEVNIPLDGMKRVVENFSDLAFDQRFRNDISKGKIVTTVDVPF